MQRTLVALCAATASLGAWAQSSISIGGTLDLAVRHVRNGSLGTVSSQVSGANSTSKLVIRGTEDLGNGLSAGFFLDSTLLGDTGLAGSAGANGPFWDRRSTLSLVHRHYGELRMGRDWVPTHLAWSAFDPFLTLGVASANSFRSFSASRALGQAFGTAPESQAANPTLRVSNALEYFLPATLGGLYGSLIATAGEGGSTAAGFTKGSGLRLGWTGAGLHVGAAQFITRNTAAGRRFKDDVVGASYDFGRVKLSLAQRRWVFASDTTVTTQLGVQIPLGAGVLKLTHVRADQTGATAALSANDARLLGAGYVHGLSRRTALYGHVARIDNAGAASFAVPGGPAVSGVRTAANYFGGQRSTAFEMGVRHDF